MLKNYHFQILEFIWSRKKGVIAREVFNHINKKNKKRKLSKAAILIFLDRLKETGLLEVSNESCRGGYRKRYYISKSKDKTIEKFIENSIKVLSNKYPKETLVSLLNILYKKYGEDHNAKQEFLRKISKLDPSLQRSLELSLWKFDNSL